MAITAHSLVGVMGVPYVITAKTPSGSKVDVKIAGVWKEASVSVKIGGVWKTVHTVWVKVAGVWKQL